MKDGYIDLHVHSKCSDGKWTLEEIINYCKENNISVLSFTEHYNLGSYKKARFLAGEDIEIIPGIELGTTLSDMGYSKNHVCHILAYYPTYKICKILDEYELSRCDCVKKTIKKLNMSIPISFSDVKKYARNKNSIGRFDIAIALYKLGYALDPISAYGEYLDNGKSYYVERKKLTTQAIISRIREVHGIPVLAHPKSLKMNIIEMENFLTKLKDYGLEGIEVYNSHHTPEQISLFKEMAEYFNFACTVGSDFHGRSEDNTKVGFGLNNNLMISDYEIIKELKRRHSNIIL